MNTAAAIAFESVEHLSIWLERHHAIERELWVRVFKKESGIRSVAWDDCVIAALIWGWIDCQRRALDDISYLQRITPRQPKSKWSKRNCAIAERLIHEGAMRPSGVAQVQAAQRDGRWERAYSGSADMVLPAEFVMAIAQNARANRFFESLGRRDRFAIYLRLHHAKQPQTRQRQIADVIAQLARGVKPT